MPVIPKKVEGLTSRDSTLENLPAGFVSIDIPAVATEGRNRARAGHLSEQFVLWDVFEKPIAASHTVIEQLFPSRPYREILPVPDPSNRLMRHSVHEVLGVNAASNLGVGRLSHHRKERMV